MQKSSRLRFENCFPKKASIPLLVFVALLPALASRVSALEGFQYSVGGPTYEPGTAGEGPGVTFFSPNTPPYVGYRDEIFFNGDDPTGLPATLLIFMGGEFRCSLDFATGRIGQPLAYRPEGLNDVFYLTFRNGENDFLPHRLGGSDYTPGDVHASNNVSFWSTNQTHRDQLYFNGDDPGGLPANLLIYVGGKLRAFIDFSSGRIGQPYGFRADDYPAIFFGKFESGTVELLTFSTWSRGNTNSSQLVKYALGGASNPAEPGKNNQVGPTNFGGTNFLCLRSFVRTSDPKLSVVGETSTNLLGTWSTNQVTTHSFIPSEPAPTGTEPREFRVPMGENNEKRFLRLKVTLAP